MYQDYLERLAAICAEKQLPLKLLGRVGSGRLPMYAVVIEPNEAIQTICFSAGIHGDEVAGPLAVLEFLEKMDVEKLATRIILFPVVNPTGFNAGTRRNEKQRDLNRHFDEENLEGEKKLLYSFLKKFRVDVLHTLHEDTNQTAFYAYAYSKKLGTFHSQILTIARKFFAIYKNPFLYLDKNSNGIVQVHNAMDGSFETRMHREGVPLIICVETPAKMALKKRVKVQRLLMEHTIFHATAHSLNHTV